MHKFAVAQKFDIGLILAMLLHICISIIILRSIAPYVFPGYFVYLFLGIIAFIVFSQISFDILSVFSWQFYIGSIIFLLIPLLIGQVTRGAVRWIPIGSLTIQPSELVRPFLFCFFSVLVASEKITLKRYLRILILGAIPLGLIFIQPSLGVTVLTAVGFLGVLLSSGIKKKYIFIPFLILIISFPLIWQIMASHQRGRIMTFISPGSDTTGAGYNSLQSMISVGSGRLLGRGLGQGVQTQLLFLPERHTDFIFASLAEELGFLGAVVLIFVIGYLISRIIAAIDHAQSPEARLFLSAVFLSYLTQVVVHIGMNMGMFPITGLPLPLVSAGGSSLLATMITLGMVNGSRK